MEKCLFILILTCFFSSCITQSPKYASVEQVFSLKTGMTKQQISDSLGVPPYDIRWYSDTATQYIYKYRTTERRTFSIYIRKTNGIKATGKYVDLFITYDKQGKATEIRSCSECGETKIQENRLNLDAIGRFFTATVPAVLVYLGLKGNQ
jgi:outer membrane protein assembly factor BamE (lipoprotein component of BamABCDE complex)